jgi:hypothetical protein
VSTRQDFGFVINIHEIDLTNHSKGQRYPGNRTPGNRTPGNRSPGNITVESQNQKKIVENKTYFNAKIS